MLYTNIKPCFGNRRVMVKLCDRTRFFVFSYFFSIFLPQCLALKIQKEKHLLVYNGFIFEKDYTKNDKTYRICIQYNIDNKCRGRLYIQKTTWLFNIVRTHTITHRTQRRLVRKKNLANIKEIA